MNEKLTQLSEDVGQTLRMNPAYTCVAVDENHLHIRAGPWSGPIYRIEDADRDGILGRVAETLTGTVLLDELLDGFDDEEREQILSVLKEMKEENFILNPSDSPVPSETAGYISLTDQFSESALDRLANDRLLVINFGAIGRMLVEDIVKCGAGRVDYATPTSADDGEVADLNSVERHGLDDPESIVKSADFVVYTEDEAHPDVINRINRLCIETGTAWTSGRVLGLDGLVGPTVVPGDTACYNCLRERMFANIESPDAYDTIERTSGSRSIVPPFARMVAGELAIDVINHLTNGAAFSLGRLIHHDFRNLSVEGNDVLRLPRCEVCQDIPDGMGHQEHVTMDQIVDEVSGND